MALSLVPAAAAAELGGAASGLRDAAEEAVQQAREAQYVAADWKFGEEGVKSGSIAGGDLVIADQSGNGNDLKMQTYGAGDWEDYLSFSPDSMTGGGSMVFDGDSAGKTGADFITVDGAAINSEEFRDGYTLEFIYYFPEDWTAADQWMSLMGRQGSGGGNPEAEQGTMYASISNCKEIQFITGNAGGSHYMSSAAWSVTMDEGGVWYHIAIVSDGHEIATYVNGCEAFRDYVEHPLVRRLYLTDVGFFPCAQDHYRERKDGIEEYILIYCTEGKGVIRVEGREYHLGPNQAFCIPRWRGHRYWACGEEPWSILWVHFKGEDTAFYPLDEERIVSFSGIHEENRMMFLFDLLFRALEGDYTLGNFIYLSQVLSLILGELYQRERKGGGEGSRRVTDIVRYMVRHLGEPLTLEQLAQEFDLSKSGLHALFQKHTGRSPMDFFLRLKMKEACKMLRSTSLRVYEVAQRLGYQDPYYFSRIFRKVVGISPKEYQNSEYFHYQE